MLGMSRKFKWALPAIVALVFYACEEGTNPEEPVNQDVTTGDMPADPPTDESGFMAETVYFGFDRDNISQEEDAKLQKIAEHLKANPNKTIQIEGHCDKRGSTQYNLGLGERRAVSVKNRFMEFGVRNQVTTVSYGEERPVAEGDNEAAFARNRRAEFTLVN